MRQDGLGQEAEVRFESSGVNVTTDVPKEKTANPQVDLPAATDKRADILTAGTSAPIV
jgi:hypothetical protein